MKIHYTVDHHLRGPERHTYSFKLEAWDCEPKDAVAAVICQLPAHASDFTYEMSGEEFSRLTR